METQLELFNTDKYESESKPDKPSPDSIVTKRKIRSPQRDQIKFTVESLDSALPMNHSARMVWKFVQLLDLEKAYKAIVSLENCTGRAATDPRILISLWIYGISEGIASGRKIGELTKDHRGFAWICGGVPVGHHSLSGFRSKFSELFEELVVNSIASLVSKGVLDLKEVSQDGVKVHANASKNSFRRKQSLIKIIGDVRQHIRKLEEQQKNGTLKKEEKKIKDKELQDAIAKEKNLKHALKELDRFKKKRNENNLKNNRKELSNKDVSKLRSSTTDPECRKMKMADASFKPAYNVQISTDVKTELVLYAKATQNGSDGGEMLRMFKDLKKMYNKDIDKYLVDSGYKNRENLKEVHAEGTSVYTPTDKHKPSLRDKVLNVKNRRISDAEIDLVERMETEEGRIIYNKRIRVSETIHAYFRNHGLGQLLVRGICKVEGVINLYCLTYNMTVLKRMGVI